jgi:hypothetical protein
MRDLVDRSPAEVRVKAGIRKRTYVSLGGLIEELATAAAGRVWRTSCARMLPASTSALASTVW